MHRIIDNSVTGPVVRFRMQNASIHLTNWIKIFSLVVRVITSVGSRNPLMLGFYDISDLGAQWAEALRQCLRCPDLATEL